MTLNLYLITQTGEVGYDEYDSAVVVAKSMDDAQKICPCGYYEWSDEEDSWLFLYDDGRKEKETYPRTDWANHKDGILVTFIGYASEHLKEGEVVLNSYNAG